MGFDFWHGARYIGAIFWHLPGEEDMKAAQIVAPRLIKVIDAEEPQVTQSGQIKIQMERAGRMV